MPERPNSDRRRDSRGDSRSDSRGDFRTGGRSSTPRPASGTGRPPGPRPSRPAGARDDDRRGDSRGDSRGGDRDRGPRRDFGDRPSGDRDRAPRRDFGDRPSGDRDRAPRREFGDRPSGDSRGGDRDRAPRRYGSDARRDDSRGDRRPGADRGPRREFGDRPSGDRGPRREYGDRPVRRDDSRGDRPSGDRAPRRDFGGDRPTGDRRPGADRGPRREYGDRPVRRDDSRGDSRGGDRDRAPRRDFGDRDRAPRREFGDRDRAPRRDDSGPDSRGGDRDRAPRRYGAGAGRPSGPRRDDSRDGGRRSGPRREDFAPRGPKNEAERRREAVRSRGGGEVRKDREQTPVSREAETWVDEGRIEDDVRDAAEGAVRRALAPRRTVSARPKDEDELDPQTKADVAKVLEPVRANRLSGRLKAAQIALERERYSEAKRIAKSLTKELSGVAAVHEVIGLASYRMGQWRDATAALELARSIRLHIEDMPVLADCYRAQRRWSDVDAVWAELKELSPSPEVMAEGRMVAAGSLSDRGELKDAIELMLKVAAIPRRVHEYHLKQWYVLGDLYDKAGNVQKAREFFQRVALHDKEYADVSERLASL